MIKKNPYNNNFNINYFGSYSRYVQGIKFVTIPAYNTNSATGK